MSETHSLLLQCGFRQGKKNKTIYKNDTTKVVVEVLDEDSINILANPKNLKGLVVGYYQHIFQVKSKNPRREFDCRQRVKLLSELNPLHGIL